MAANGEGIGWRRQRWPKGESGGGSAAGERGGGNLVRRGRRRKEEDKATRQKARGRRGKEGGSGCKQREVVCAAGCGRGKVVGYVAQILLS